MWPFDENRRALPTSSVLLGSILMSISGTRDLVYNPTWFLSRPDFAGEPFVIAGIGMAIGWLFISTPWIRGLVAVGIGAASTAFICWGAVFNPALTFAPTTAAYGVLLGSLLVLLGGFSLLLVSNSPFRRYFGRLRPWNADQ